MRYHGFDGFYGIVSARTDVSKRFDVAATTFIISWHRCLNTDLNSHAKQNRCPGSMMSLAGLPDRISYTL